VATSVYLAASEPESGKSAVALALLDRAVRRVGRVGVFRPVVRADPPLDPTTELLRARASFDVPYQACVGVTYDDVHQDPDAAMTQIVARYRALAAQCDAVIVVGSDFTDVAAPTELAFNASIAVNLGSPVVVVINGKGRSAEQILQAGELATDVLVAAHCHVLGVVVNRCDPRPAERLAELVDDPRAPIAVIPHEPLLRAPTVRQLGEAVGAGLLAGDPGLLDNEASAFVIAAMRLPHMLDHLVEGSLVVFPGDRDDILIGVLSAHRADTFPNLAGVLLTGGFEPEPQVRRLMEGRVIRLPVLRTEHDTYTTSTLLASTRGRITLDAHRKIDRAITLVEKSLDVDAILDQTNLAPSGVVTPLVFEYELFDRARQQRTHIVLPEGTEPRVLRAAEILLRRDVCDLTLLGEESRVRAVAAELGVDIAAAGVADPLDPDQRLRFAQEYARLRAHKGVTVDSAMDVVVDVSYYGTLLVHLGLADGMVSGAVHTTAHTIRPSFEIIKTVPGTSIVSSVFFMCLPDRVLVYGDCAVNPDPTAEQLADIAISSAATAALFGIQPRIAMLSYSTGSSGSGAEVDKVRRATELVRQRRPDLSVEGPIQYDAAVDASVALTKLPGSEVAGRATVFIFPDLNTGNNTYKAVQRSAGAIAIGPILQGLNKPVNDLSRGALVEDIVNTVGITAVQAQQPAGSPSSAAPATAGAPR
jgi:phosphate acetyltransferase